MILLLIIIVAVVAVYFFIKNNPKGNTQATQSDASQTAEQTTCPICGHQISSKAVTCPQCGHPVGYDSARMNLKTFLRKKWVKVILVIIAIIIIGRIIGSIVNQWLLA